MQDLVRKAEGDSVTVARLDGSERYYPDASRIFDRPYRREGEIPHHVVLLAKGGTGVASGHTGSLIFTNQAVHFVSSYPTFLEVPYEEISSIKGRKLRKSGTIRFVAGGREYKFGLAVSGESDHAVAAFDFFRGIYR